MRHGLASARPPGAPFGRFFREIPCSGPIDPCVHILPTVPAHAGRKSMPSRYPNHGQRRRDRAVLENMCSASQTGMRTSGQTNQDFCRPFATTL